MVLMDNSHAKSQHMLLINWNRNIICPTKLCTCYGFVSFSYHYFSYKLISPHLPMLLHWFSWWLREHNIEEILTHCNQVMPNDDIELGQHWLKWWFGACWQQSNTWTNVDLSTMVFCSTQFTGSPQDEMGRENILVELLPHLQGDNELNHNKYHNTH